MRISDWSSDVCSSDLLLAELQVAVHGQSFSTPAVTDNLVPSYPAAAEHHFNIGMLHTALAGRKGHADYAPCSLDDLKAKQYDYWALGHEIGRAHVSTPVTNAHLVCRLLLEKKKKTKNTQTQ